MNNSTKNLTANNVLKVKAVLKRGVYISLFLVLGTVLSIALLLRQARDVQSAKTVHDQTKALLDKEEIATGLLEKYQGEDQKILELYPDERSIIKFVDEVESLGSLHGDSPEFNFGSQSKLKDSNGYPYLPFTISFTGELDSLLGFLENYENMPYLTAITSIEAKSLNGIEGSGTYIIKGNIYVSENF